MNGDGVSLVPKGFLEAALAKAIESIGDELTASAKAMSPLRRSPSVAANTPWPFGTIVRWPEAGITALVLVDDGATCHAVDFGDLQVHTLKRDKYTFVAAPDTP